MRKTKIICTLGPAVDNDEKIAKLLEAGMDCARLNFSHGNHQEHRERINRARRVSGDMRKPLAILLDTKGPEIRISTFVDGRAVLEEGQQFILDDKKDMPGDATRVGRTCGDLWKSVKPGDQILVDDGKVELAVVKADGGAILCDVIHGGVLKDRKSINVPEVVIPMSFMSETDKKDILFGIEMKVDFIAASFVRSAEDVREMRKFLNDNGGKNIWIISKVESRQSIANLDEIIEASDGVMVARGDLGVEIPFSQIPAIQKEIIHKCTLKAKLIVTATQMLESMTKSPRPTRAEVSDVANAIFDGTDVIMLSGETAAGNYPVESVKTMAEIALTTEKFINYNREFIRDYLSLEKNIANTICASAYSAARFVGAKAIVAVTRSGRTAKRISDFRPNCPIIAVTLSDVGIRRLCLEWGVHPVASEFKYNANDLFENARAKALETGLVKEGDIIVVVTSSDSHMTEVDDILRVCIA